jgi:hypothetical protein
LAQIAKNGSQITTLSILKVSESRKQFFIFSILPKNERKRRVFSLFSFVFGRIENTINCF